MASKIINLFGKEKKTITPIKYSKLIEEIIHKFEDELNELPNFETIIELVNAAWNTGNLKDIVSPDEFKNIIASSLEDDIYQDIFLKLVDYKVLNYREYTNFIIDYTLTKEVANTDPSLTIISMPKDQYLDEMMNVIDNIPLEDFDNDDGNYDENFINRTAITIKPKQPFLDWYANLDVDQIAESDLQDVDTYLISEDIEDVEKWLKNNFDKFFTVQLGAWHTNKKKWPKNRTYKLFNLWFRVEKSELVYDIEAEPVLK